MTKWSKTAGLLFMAAASVYYGQAVVAAPGKTGSVAGGAARPGADKPSPTDVRLLDDLSPAPAQAAPAAAAKPAEKADAKADAVVNQGGGDAKPAEGRSVSKSEVNVSDEGTVEIHVNDASLVEVLRMLSLQSQKNIVCSKDVRGTVTANLYNVTIREALDQILHMNGYAYREKGNFINVYTTKELQVLEEAERKTTTEVFRLHYTPAANALVMVKPALSQIGQAAATTPAQAGIAAGGTDVGGNSHAVEDMIVVTDYPDNLEKVRKLLKELDRRPQQVLIEATILRAALSEDNALGVDFNVLAGVKFTDFLTSNGQITGGGTTAGNPGASSATGVGSVGTGNTFTSTVPGGMKVGFVSDNVSIFLAALEGVTDTVVLANPKILALNKQKGEVIVGRKDGYITSTTTDTATVQTVEFLDTGTRLIFRPFIADDGFVRMELHPEDSSGGLTGANLPFKITTELTSNIMVRDGHTIVIGGLFRESSDSARSQTPLLGNIPLAGALFRNQRDRTTREEIIILLTPHIIKDQSAYAKLSEEELKKAEALRVGVRKGMMPWGRERLAESCYEQARAELAKPNPNTQAALWHLDCATNLNPKFLEAIELKQQVTGKEVTGVDSSSVRHFVKRMVLADKAPVEPAAPVPPSKTDGQAPAKPGNSTAGVDPEEDLLGELEEQWSEMPLEGEPGEPARTAQAETEEVSSAPAGQSDKSASSEKSAKSEQAAKPEEAAKSDKAGGEPVARVQDEPKAEAKPEVKAEAKPEVKPEAGNKPAFSVTELPMEEVKPDAPKTDESK